MLLAQDFYADVLKVVLLVNVEEDVQNRNRCGSSFACFVDSWVWFSAV